MADALHLHRRVCVLRATGQQAEAARLERTELSAVLAALPAGDDAAALAALFAGEVARVTEAATLAEVLAPLLAAQLASKLQPAETGSKRLTREDAPRIAGPTAPRSVADFIDDMLAEERALSRSK